MHCVPLPGPGLLNHFLHNPPRGLWKDVTSLSNNFDYDN